MDRTALALTREEWQTYHPGTAVDQDQLAGRWERARAVARAAAQVLYSQFGATRVVAFGSLVRRDWFTPWSDVDLGAWGIPPHLFYRAVAAVTGLSSEFKVDLIAHEDCQPALRRAIEKDGILL
jgi:predicted nucleotidyltransferase